MIVSEHWLKDWLSTDLSAQQIADRLTLAGLEVDGVETLAGELPHVVVGQVLSVEKHPDADRLNLTSVDVGEAAPLSIVCGAPNVVEGMLVAVAMVGAVLPNGLKIKQAKVRGIISNGMLCSAAELGLETDSDGLIELDPDAEVGTRVDEYLNLEDALIDIDLTPNRGDCLSVQGVARELRVLVGGDYHPLDSVQSEVTSEQVISVTVHEPARCPAYLGRIVSSIDASATTPLWMQERLRRSGLRPKSPVVDITNYVMLELGQPMHAFDLHRIDSRIEVRCAAKGESIELLDGSSAKLNDDTLVIADAMQPIAIAGVMGGLHSAIDSNTTDIVLESAHFTKSSAAGAARQYGLHTDSSFRYERGVDILLPEIAMERATELVLAICGGSAGPITSVENQELRASRAKVSLRFARLQQLLGLPLTHEEVDGILRRVSDEVETTEDGWCVTAPSYRFDLEYEADLIEEIARVKGYDSIPTTIPRIAPRSRIQSETRVDIKKVRQTLIARGSHECINYSFVAPSELAPFTGEPAVKVVNPLAENLSVMRTTLLAGIIKSAAFNLNRQKDRLRLFEIGASYHRSDLGFTEQNRLAGLLYGTRLPQQWAADNSEKVDFYDLKSEVESILALRGKAAKFEFSQAKVSYLHPGQSAQIVTSNGERVGVLGRLHPRLQKAFDFDAPVFIYELNLATLLDAKVPNYEGISRFPESKRDVSVVVDKSIAVEEILSTIRKEVSRPLHDVALFDIYSGKGIEEHQHSVSIKLSLRHPERTLTDEETQACVDSVLALLADKFSGKLR